jgi:hypothetical protein
MVIGFVECFEIFVSKVRNSRWMASRRYPVGVVGEKYFIDVVT